MSTLQTINSTDLITNSRADINGNFSALNADKMETSVLDTDTTLAANSDSKVPTQKAVKAYVDAGGNVNASETTKGIVEEATDAEVTAGTATGGSGAKLFVSPAKLNTQIDAKIAAYRPFYQQTLSTSIKEAIADATMRFCSGSDASGDTLFFSTAITNLYRFARDTNTGMYFQTHRIDPAFAYASNGDTGSIVVLGSYMYLFSNDGTNIVCSRFLAADLTGEQVMTVPTVPCTTNVICWTDGTDVYLVSASSDTTSRRWTLSGTTFTAASTATITTGLFSGGATTFTSLSDGTNTYVASRTTNTITVYKNTVIDGSSRTSSTISPHILSDSIGGVFLTNFDSTKIYCGYLYDIYDETAAIVSAISLFPKTKP